MEFVKDSVFNYTYPCESDLIDISKYFEDYSKLLIPFESCQNEKCKTNELLGCREEDCKNDKIYTQFLGISKEQLQELKEITNVEHLTCPGEIQPISHEYHKRFCEENLKPKPKSEEDNAPKPDLVSLKKREEMDFTKTELSRALHKYNNYQWSLNTEKLLLTKLDFGCYDNVVACVKIYHPFSSSQADSYKIKLLQEIHILGSQKLSELRDKILCALDYIGAKDMSTEYFLKDVGYNVTAKDEYPSSFIFIEKTFYNDTRTPDLIDLSKVIRDWASERGLGKFECKSMENTRICDLHLKIGRPYVYQHQGNCEHLLVFSDIRFAELGEPSKLTSYPRIHCFGRLYGKHCMMCGVSYAKWLVVGNERLTHDRTYLCKKCFLSYNYINGIKIGQFEAYKYVDAVALL